MKTSISGALRHNRQHFASMKQLALSFSVLLLIAISLGSCQKDVSGSNGNQLQSTNENAVVSESNPINNYTGLSPQTQWELQQARAATAKYLDINNAIADGYSNINVDVPNMGHHLMKASLIDGTFDIRHPEILVYNGLDTGHPQLIAVEYALPLSGTPPEGFTGSSDVWNGTSGFPFWLVHAWVWKYNPAGPFNWTNPDVDLD